MEASGSAPIVDVVTADLTMLVDSVNGTNATTLTGALRAIDGNALS